MTAAGPRARLLRCLPFVAALALAGGGPAHAARGDADKPLNISGDKGGQLDLVRQRTEWVGNVMISRGTMLLKAERMDVRQTGDGYIQASARGEDGKPVSFRQERDVPGEFVEGFADQVEYDSRSDTVRFVGHAVVRVLRGVVVSDELTGAVIVFDNRNEQLRVEPGANALQPNGRVRATMMPRGASAPAPSASAPTGLPLRISPQLQTGKTP